MVRLPVVFIIPSLVLSLSIASGCGATGDPDDPATWGELALSIDSKLQKQAFAELERLGDRSVPTLLDLLTKTRVAFMAAQALGKVGSPAVVPDLVAAIDWIVPQAETPTAKAKNRANQRIAEALGNIGSPDAIEPLIRLLRSPVADVQLAAIQALGKLHSKEAIPMLSRLVSRSGTNPFLTKNAIIVLGNLGEASVADVLMPMLFEERRGVSFFMETSYAMFQIGGAPLIDRLLTCLEGTNPVVEKAKLDFGLIEPAVLSKCATVLGDMAEPIEYKTDALSRRIEKDLLDVLNTKIEDTNPNAPFQVFARVSAAEALARLRAYRAVDFLVDKVREVNDTSYRRAMAQALVEFGQTKALPFIRQACTLGDFEKRVQAFHALSRLGGAAEIPFMNSLLPPEEKQRAKAQAELDAIVTRIGAEDAKCGPDAKCLAKKSLEVSGALLKVQDYEAAIEAIKNAIARLEVAKECTDKVDCWVAKLRDTTLPTFVRDRAAYTLGHLKKTSSADALFEALATGDYELRYAAYWALDHMDIATGADKVDAVLSAEAGKAQFARVNEYLKRLTLRIKRRAPVEAR